MVGIGLASFVNAYVFPVPDRIIEGFAEVFTADQLPLWQLLFFGALMPALFEELAFRGLLLNGLVQRLRPWTKCLVVGAVFGLFHVAVFRILPTAYMGVVLAAVVLMTGSVYPAMVWHALNNAVAVIPARMGWIDPTQWRPPLWSYPLALMGLAASLLLLWRFRRPLPTMRVGSGPSLPVGVTGRDDGARAIALGH